MGLLDDFSQLLDRKAAGSHFHRHRNAKAAAFARARYYDRILHKPESALLEYRSFVSLYPDAPQAAEARARIALLKTEEKEK